MEGASTPKGRVTADVLAVLVMEYNTISDEWFDTGRIITPVILCDSEFSVPLW